MIEKLLNFGKESLNNFFDQIDLDSANTFLNILKECKGMIILSGVGKSGLIAEKIAMTLTSTGSRAFFLSPTNALHGDIGIVSKEDIFIMISKSGESEELLQMIPFLRNKGVQLLAIVNNSNNRLTRASDFSMVLPPSKELCPFNMVPTISTTTQMIFGDTIAVALMVQKDFTLSQFAMNHPAGKIGRRLTLRAKDLMLTKPNLPLASPSLKLIDSLVELSDKRCGCLLVIDKEEQLLGVFTDGDLRRGLQNFGSSVLERTIGELMTQNPRTISDMAMASEALDLMEADQKHPITILPVVDGTKRILGLIKMHDIIQSGL